MSVIYTQAQKQRYRITLELETLEDFDPHQIDWESLFELEGSERVIDSYVEDLSVPNRWWCKCYSPLKCPYSVDNNHSQIMNRSLMLGLLNRAANGDELLAVLDVIAEDYKQS